MGSSNTVNENTKKAIKAANFLSNYNALKLEPGYYKGKQIAEVTKFLQHTNNVQELDFSRQAVNNNIGSLHFKERINKELKVLVTSCTSIEKFSLCKLLCSNSDRQ